MIYEEASTSPLVDSRRIREAYILILVTSTQTRPDKGVTELYDYPNDVFRIVAVPVYSSTTRPLSLTGKCQLVPTAHVYMKCHFW